METAGVIQKYDIEALLREGKTIRIFPQGYSMYPMFVPGRDEAVITAADTGKLHRGDVVLYRRKSGILVLHRIYRRKGTVFYMVGDHQKEIEGPIYAEQIKGILVVFVRRGKMINTRNPIYCAAVHIWLFLRPVRIPVMKAGAKLKQKLRT